MLFLCTVTRGGVITVVFLNVFRLSASSSERFTCQTQNDPCECCLLQPVTVSDDKTSVKVIKLERQTAQMPQRKATNNLLQC